jgi:hypothetical protein
MGDEQGIPYQENKGFGPHCHPYPWFVVVASNVGARGRLVVTEI